MHQHCHISVPDLQWIAHKEQMLKGSFLTWEDTAWVEVDNTTGEAWTEEFSSEDYAVRWLRRQFEVYH